MAPISLLCLYHGLEDSPRWVWVCMFFNSPPTTHECSLPTHLPTFARLLAITVPLPLLREKSTLLVESNAGAAKKACVQGVVVAAASNTSSSALASAEGSFIFTRFFVRFRLTRQGHECPLLVDIYPRSKGA